MPEIYQLELEHDFSGAGGSSSSSATALYNQLVRWLPGNQYYVAKGPFTFSTGLPVQVSHTFTGPFTLPDGFQWRPVKGEISVQGSVSDTTSLQFVSGYQTATESYLLTVAGLPLIAGHTEDSTPRSGSVSTVAPPNTVSETLSINGYYGPLVGAAQGPQSDSRTLGPVTYTTEYMLEIYYDGGDYTISEPPTITVTMKVFPADYRNIVGDISGSDVFLERYQASQLPMSVRWLSEITAAFETVKLRLTFEKGDAPPDEEADSFYDRRLISHKGQLFSKVGSTVSHMPSSLNAAVRGPASFNSEGDWKDWDAKTLSLYSNTVDLSKNSGMMMRSLGPSIISKSNMLDNRDMVRALNQKWDLETPDIEMGSCSSADAGGRKHILYLSF